MDKRTTSTRKPDTRQMGAGGPNVVRIGQGTWEMEHDDDPVTALRRGLDLGLTHIDTAEMYGNGAVERIVGEAIRGRREEVFLVSKVLPYNASLDGTLAACERSLRHLQTDCLDLYLLHWPGSHPLDETFEAFDQLQRAGRIRAFGVSNFDDAELAEAVAVAGPGRIACNQVLYHPGERTIERRLMPAAARLGVPIVAYSPLGNGRLPSPGSPGGKALATIATARGVSIHQVALRFVLRDGGVAFAIPKAGRAAHVADNAATDAWALEPDEVAALEAALPAPAGGRGIPML